LYLNNYIGVISIKHQHIFFFFICLLLVGIGTSFLYYIMINIGQFFVYNKLEATQLNSTFVPFHIVLMIVSSIILSTLVYVSWRKHRALREKEKKTRLK